MPLRDTVDIDSNVGQVVISRSFDQRVWTEENEALETDYYRETIEVRTWQYPGCTLSAAENAVDAAEDKTATEDASGSTVFSGRYFLESKKTSPRAYAVEVTLELRDRFKNGEAIPGSAE